MDNMDMSYYNRYRHIPIYMNKDKVIIAETYRFPIIEKRDSDQYYIVPKDDMNWDEISNLSEVYDDEHLWWILAIANEVRDPMKSPKKGDVLRVPSILELKKQNNILYG